MFQVSIQSVIQKFSKDDESFDGLWGRTVSHRFQRNQPWPKLRQVAANVLFFEPLEDCAGMAASFEILAQSVPPSLFSAFATQSMIHFRDWVFGGFKDRLFLFPSLRKGA